MFRRAGFSSAGSDAGASAAGGSGSKRTWSEIRARLRHGAGDPPAPPGANGDGGGRPEPAPPEPAAIERARPEPASAPARAALASERRLRGRPGDVRPADAGAPLEPARQESARQRPAAAEARREEPAPDAPREAPARTAAASLESPACPAPERSGAADVSSPVAGAATPAPAPQVPAGGRAEPPTATGSAAPKPRPAAPAPSADEGRSGGQRPAEHADPGRLLGQVSAVAGSATWVLLEPDAANLAQIGTVVRLHNRRGKSFGMIITLKNDGRRAGDDRRLAEIRLLGEILLEGPARGRFQRGVSSYPPLDSEIHAAGQAEFEAIYAPPQTATVRLGTLSHDSGLPAYAITDNLLGKHFAVLGSTGAGKSCAVTVILRAILDANPFGHVVMLDPHNEYGRAFGKRAELINPTNLKLPYWLLSYEELASLLVSKDAEHAYAEAVILKDALLAARRAFVGAGREAENVTVDSPIPYRVSELARLIREAMGAFNRPESSAAYQHLISRLESLASDKRYAFMFSSFLVHDNMHQVLARILRIPVADKPITIIDISGVPSEIVDVVVSVLFRLIFEFALWSERAKSPPILLVCEEAHRYVPKDDQTGFAPTKRSISRIAKEGRKYGLGLCLVTQRPSELATSSLSQCNTIFALRLSNERDLEFVRHAVTDSSRWLTDALPALNTQEAVVLGDGVSVPMHIRFDELDPDSRPASTTPQFSQIWQGEIEDDALIRETIERWRQQTRLGPAE